jgi:hypothetical protein
MSTKNNAKQEKGNAIAYIVCIGIIIAILIINYLMQ